MEAKLAAATFVSKRPKMSRLFFFCPFMSIFLFVEAIETPYVPASNYEYLFG
jgi:hypothetical protein